MMWSRRLFRFLTTPSVHTSHVVREKSTQATRQSAFIAFGSNVGNRAGNIVASLKKLERAGKVLQTSFLYESRPMYKTDQPKFLNGVIQLNTHLSPIQLLHTVKEIEKELGRELIGERNGPRPIDLDILLYGRVVLNDKCKDLTIPHPRLAERQFVLQPLVDIDPCVVIPSICATIPSETAQSLLHSLQRREGNVGLARVTPLPNDRGHLCWGNRTLLMGILNITPDSFSDGGEIMNIDNALKQAEVFARHGFDVLDIGGQSTRPGASYVSVDDELRRVIPVLKQVRAEMPSCALSIDTFHARVAREAMEAGADIINDVTGGTYDKEMYAVMAETGAATVLMHMRGTPATMNKLTQYKNNDVVTTTSTELKARIMKAHATGVARWAIIADSGIGFAKNQAQNMRLVAQAHRFKHNIGNFPCLLGLSRKSWMRHIVDNNIESRDWATAGAVSTAIISGGVDIVRVHNPLVSYAVRACDAIRAHAL